MRHAAGVVACVIGAGLLSGCHRDAAINCALPGQVRKFGAFSIRVPVGARIISADSASGRLELSWPGCENCNFAVTVKPDSGIDVGARIARLVAEQRRIDSVNKVPDAVSEFDEINEPPRPFTTPSANGYLIDHSCGDCAAMTVLFGRPGWIAEISYGGDAVPGLAAHLCEMTESVKTFAWSGIE